MSAQCQVCGQTPAWADFLSGDIICEKCANWSLIARFLIHLTGHGTIPILFISAIEEVEGLANGVYGPHTDLGGLH